MIHHWRAIYFARIVNGKIDEAKTQLSSVANAERNIGKPRNQRRLQTIGQNKAGVILILFKLFC